MLKSINMEPLPRLVRCIGRNGELKDVLNRGKDHHQGIDESRMLSNMGYALGYWIGGCDGEA